MCISDFFLTIEFRSLNLKKSLAIASYKIWIVRYKLTVAWKKWELWGEKLQLPSLFIIPSWKQASTQITLLKLLK